MSFFGSPWDHYMEKIETNWRSCIQEKDLVLIPGDISWAMTLEEAQKDLLWIDRLPGTKLILRGNHDYWWASNAKMQKSLPPSIHFIHNTAFHWDDVTIGGSRLWDTSEYTFDSFVQYQENPKASLQKPSPEESEKVFAKELMRLRISLEQLSKSAALRIALTHYPPIGADLAPSSASRILQEFHIQICVFGHLHSIKKNALPFGSSEGIRYLFASADYLNFVPLQIA
jgi:predicted phosphohydrolase